MSDLERDRICLFRSRCQLSWHRESAVTREVMSTRWARGVLLGGVRKCLRFLHLPDTFVQSLRTSLYGCVASLRQDQVTPTLTRATAHATVMLPVGEWLPSGQVCAAQGAPPGEGAGGKCRDYESGESER